MDISKTSAFSSYVLHQISHPFLIDLEKLESKHFYDIDILSQFTIDYLQEWDADFGDDLQNLSWYHPGSLSYRAEKLIEVMKEGKDKDVIMDFYNIYESWFARIQAYKNDINMKNE